MKTSPERDELLNAVLSGDDLDDVRTASLARTLNSVRRLRRQRHALRAAGAVVTIGIMCGLLWHRQTPFRKVIAIDAPPVVKSVASNVPGTNIRLVSDEELLAIFAGRPVALIGPPENRQFVLLDEARDLRSHKATRGKGESL